MKTTSKLIIIVLTSLVLAASAHALLPREELKQMVEQLQKTPTDDALREKIIKLAQGVKPAPAVPPEAKRAFVMGGTYQKEAKTPPDFALAIAAYQDALKIAPWWGDAYYNLNVSLESAGRLDEAKDALELYLLTKPKDAEQAQNRVYALEAKRNIASKQAAAAAAEAAAKTRAENSIEGAWFSANDIGDIFVTRKGTSFEVTANLGPGSVKDIQATETTLRFTLLHAGFSTFDFRREGEILVGTDTTVLRGQQWITPKRMVRKP